VWSKLIQKAREEESNRLLMFLLGLAALLVAAIGAGAAVLAVSLAPGSSGATQTTSVATDKVTNATSGPSARSRSQSRSTTTPKRQSGGRSKAGKTSHEPTGRLGAALADSGEPSATGATQSETHLGRPTSGQKGPNLPSLTTQHRPARTTPTTTPSTTPGTSPTTPSATTTTPAPATTPTTAPAPPSQTNCTIINQNEQSGEHNSNTTSNQLTC
jgi:hypothetical protein